MARLSSSSASRGSTLSESWKVMLRPSPEVDADVISGLL